MRYILAFLVFFSFASVHAQDITGIWRGHFRSNEMYQRLTGDDDRYKFEVQIAQKIKTFSAVTYSYKTTVFYGKALADGTVNPKTKKVVLKELKIVDIRMVGGDACIMTCFLQYSKLGDEEFLEGTYYSVNDRDSTNCGKGTIFLRKVATSDFVKEPFLIKREKEIDDEKKRVAVTDPPKNKSITAPVAGSKKPLVSQNTATINKPLTPKKPVKASVVTKPAEHGLAKNNPVLAPLVPVKRDSVTKPERHTVFVPTPKVLANRQNEVTQTLTVNTGDVELNIYDNGIVDNDTVSVYFDKKLLVSNARLTEQPIVVKLHLEDTGDVHELVMVAENEGDIPPNTSLMIVKAGDKQFEVHITSTEQKNAVVIFKYEKPK